MRIEILVKAQVGGTALQRTLKDLSMWPEAYQEPKFFIEFDDS